MKKDTNQTKKNPQKMESIVWRDGREKEYIVRCLNRASVVRYQPSGIIGKTSKQVLWAVQRICELADAGRLDEPDPLDILTDEIGALLRKNVELEERIAELEEKNQQHQNSEEIYAITFDEQARLLMDDLRNQEPGIIRERLIL